MTPSEHPFSNEDNFAKTAGIRSALVSGEPAIVRDPWMTMAIPTFRRPESLKRALDSVLTAHAPDFPLEIIVVDNDCDQQSKETARLIETYSDARLLYYRNERNLGVFGNWNRCLILSRGRWVAFLHDDDILAESYFKTIGSLLRRNRDIGAIAARHQVLDLRNTGSADRPCATRSKTSPWVLARLSSSIKQNMLERIHPIETALFVANIYGAPTCGSVFRKDYAIGVGGFGDSCPSEDWFFYYRLNQSHPVYRSYEVLGCYVIEANWSLDASIPARLLKDALEFRDYNVEHYRAVRWFTAFFRIEQNTILVSAFSSLVGSDIAGLSGVLPQETRRYRSFLYMKIWGQYLRTKRILALLGL